MVCHGPIDLIDESLRKNSNLINILVSASAQQYSIALALVNYLGSTIDGPPPTNASAFSQNLIAVPHYKCKDQLRFLAHKVCYVMSKAGNTGANSIEQEHVMNSDLQAAGFGIIEELVGNALPSQDKRVRFVFVFRDFICNVITLIWKVFHLY